MLLMPNDVVPSPISIMTDFEAAAMNSFRSHFPQADVSGCYFHLGQSAWRKIQKIGNGLPDKYKAEPEFALRVRKFLALAFVPTDQVRDYMQLLLRDEASRGDGLLATFAEYFQRIYVGQEYLIAERFDRATWNMYQRVKEQLPRTNNAVEGFHSAFAKDIKDHPPITVLSQKYRKVQHHKANMRKQHLDGRKLPPVKKTYQKVTASIRRQVERFDNGLIENLVYLEQIAKVMTINTE